MRKCQHCKQEKDDKEFKPYSPQCGDCRKLIQKRYRERIYNDDPAHFKYKLRRAAHARAYKERQKAAGIDLWVTVPERYKAIMALI
jgi:recombinational DNA repair protein (RecF pathway)